VNVSALPKQFKTYHIEDDFQDCKIWEVARATSAATTFFKSVSIGRQGIEFIDVGFGHNNPSEVLWGEATKLSPNDERGCIISIGTGLGSVVTIKDTRRSILYALKAMATNSQAVHERLLRSRPLADYFRFNVTKGLEDITLSDWKQSSIISAHTSNYLAELEVERQIEHCAEILAQGQK
jgi:patatin-like phospholipase/acyl hydrolase